MNPNLTRNNNNSARKMASLVTCYKCKKMVNIKNTALCSACNNRYEFYCDGYPEPTYRLKDAEAKKKWRCKVCVRNKKYAETDSTSNITVRKKQTSIKTLSPQQQEANLINENMGDETLRQSPVQHSTLLFDSHILTECETSDESYNTPKLSRSVDRTVSDLVPTSEMKYTVSQLTLKLKSTENELGNLLLENNDLHKQINKLTLENQSLKSICHSAMIYDSTKLKQKKTRALSHQHNTYSTPTSPLSDNCNINTNDYGKISLMKQEIVTLQQQLEVAEREILTLTGRIEELMRSSHISCENYNQVPTHATSQKSVNTAKYLDSTALNVPNIYPRKRILIFGSQRCVGLAAAISRSRINTQYGSYSVVAETKPNAQSSEILAHCRNSELSADDKLVICIGENDRNSNLTLSQLQIILDKFKNNTIIVLDVLNNAYLNVNKLNYSMKNMCKQYKKCHFINKKCTKLYDICHSVNYIIDCCDYSDKYLNPSEIRKWLATNKTSSNVKTSLEAKKGTIPYYFNCHKKSSHRISTTPTLEIKSPKVGTIPYYFPVIDKNKSFFRA